MTQITWGDMNKGLLEGLAVKSREIADAAELAAGNSSAAVTDLEAISTDSAYSDISQDPAFQASMANIQTLINSTSTTSSPYSIEDNYGDWIGFSLSSSISSNGTFTSSTANFDPGHNFGTDNLANMGFLTGADKFALANLLYASSYCQSDVGEGVFQPGSWLTTGQSLSINGQPCTQNTLSASGQVLTVTLQSGIVATIGVNANNNATISFSGPANAFSTASTDSSPLINYLRND